MKENDLKYLKCLAKQYPTVAQAATEIVNLQAILSLPKGTEHFITDIHGEYEQFQHIMKNGSGAIKRKIEEEFGNAITVMEKKSLATLIYYPEQKIEQVLKDEKYMEDWYKVTMYRLIRVCKAASSKYTRSKVRKAIPQDFSYVIEELLTGRPDISDQEAYYNEIINSVIRTGQAKKLIIAICKLIRSLIVDHLHVVGDIFDRGPYPHLVMDALMELHSVDIQWGNHDLSWMGAASGCDALICNVIRISSKYGNLSMLEDGYGINLVPLARMAMSSYAKDSCAQFKLDYREDEYDVQDTQLDEKMHKAITIMQFKLEGQIIKAHPEFDMNDRLLLDKIDIERGIVKLGENEYKLCDTNFPTIDWSDPYKLSKEEEEVMDRLRMAFVNCEKLQRHVQFLFAKGSLYNVFNGNLLYHGCVPINEDGSFREVNVNGKNYAGKALYDVLENHVRKGYYSVKPEEKKCGQDIMWFLWCSKNSPVYGKERMTTFERYFIADKSIQEEPKDYYYSMLGKEEFAVNILKEFGLEGPESHIINGHVPVRTKKGESPIKCKGKLLIIDGGFSKVYQVKTGIAGYTLIYNSYGLILAAHEPFESVEKAVQDGSDIVSHSTLVQHTSKRKTVADTDVGKVIKENIKDLEELLQAYRNGTIKEH